MNTAEYWLYPTSWPETSCITALEMLLSKVICLYYPVAGLINTINDYGIQISPGNEVETIVSLSDDIKLSLRDNGYKYAYNCSWNNRELLWQNLLFKDIKLINSVLYVESDLMQKITEEYSLMLEHNYSIKTINNLDSIISINPTNIIFINNINEYEYNLVRLKLPNVQVSILNLEPLNLANRLNKLKELYKNYNIKLYDYSLANINILKENNIINVDLLEYVTTESEINYLTQLRLNNKQIYDFGIITGCGALNKDICNLGPKRRKLVEYILSLGLSVNIISDWGEKRDIELAKCKTILNIHGQLLNLGSWYNSNIFEHLRCNRLLSSGFNILSEESYYLDSNFIEKYSNLKIIKYIDFFKLDTYLLTNIVKPIRKNYCFIHSCNLKNIGTKRLEYLMNKINENNLLDIFEKIYIINIGN
jgi:hypothetical protein